MHTLHSRGIHTTTGHLGSAIQMQTMLFPPHVGMFNGPLSTNSRAMAIVPRAIKPASSASQWVADNMGQGPVVKESSMGGSDWSRAYIYETEAGAKYFVKTAKTRDDSMFRGEALGLKAMQVTNTVQVPNVQHVGLLQAGSGQVSGSFIVMDYLDLSRGGRPTQAELGRQLALMHMATPQDTSHPPFGFDVDNTIGGTPQPNGWKDSWVDFFRERRLNHQLRLAGNPQLSALGKKLSDKLEQLFEGVDVKPSILHGDLWSGNIGTTSDGRPVIFDPATYYGHSEAEFGMSWCAGFSSDFHKAYDEVKGPKAPGYAARHQLYQLYHYLNHYNMFGSSYLSQCHSILTDLTRKM